MCSPTPTSRGTTCISPPSLEQPGVLCVTSGALCTASPPRPARSSGSGHCSSLDRGPAGVRRRVELQASGVSSGGRSPRTQGEGALEGAALAVAVGTHLRWPQTDPEDSCHPPGRMGKATHTSQGSEGHQQGAAVPTEPGGHHPALPEEGAGSPSAPHPLLGKRKGLEGPSSGLWIWIYFHVCSGGWSWGRLWGPGPQPPEGKSCTKVSSQ